jgi:hypothetical protein
MIRHELRTITSSLSSRAKRGTPQATTGAATHHSNFQQNETHRATRSDEGADDREAIQRRASFLKELNNLTQKKDK